MSEAALGRSKSLRMVVDVLSDWAMRDPRPGPHRRIHIHFLENPVEITGTDGAVTGLRTERQELTGDGNVRGTGEFTDSLALDNLTHFSTKLVPFIAQQKNAVLELKTKSANITNLQHLDHGGRSIVAWSLNSPVIMQREELRTATLKQRLEAAQQCASWGYHLAFHFDPIILHPGWQEGYTETIRALFAAVPAKAIAWISLGALRYLPSLKQIAASRFPASRFFYQSFIDGLDGKRRYFREERVEMYRFIVAELQRHTADSTCLYFCMENDTIWQQVFGFSPIVQGGVPAMLDRSLHWL